MSEQELIPTKTLCLHYNIDISFVDDLNKIGRIQIQLIEEQQYIHQDQVGELEKMIRIHKELNVNIEGIDVIYNLLEKEQALRDEVNSLKNRLRLYENL
ncbi:chaperone modulator CbpM [Crocinitomix catalasitica]|uniref:chaperone modulator CbpM n=1 Tax=Crocinitomix catalasitica TaxID=184607 RepID=UPI000485BDC1|nr:chaperone modulator CbpM [Crocinitomix catalasitica]